MRHPKLLTKFASEEWERILAVAEMFIPFKYTYKQIGQNVNNCHSVWRAYR